MTASVFFIVRVYPSLILSLIGTSESLTQASGETAVATHLVSDFERAHYYNGISPDPPELLYRSDLESNPFPMPRPGDRWFQLPVKTAEGVFGTPLNPVWHRVLPQIVALLKQRCIRFSAISSARFSTYDEDRKKTLGPIVIWIATHPATTTAENARDASPEILSILEEHNVKGAVVEWYEGIVTRLLSASGPALMRSANETHPTHNIRRALTATLGIPIATQEMEDSMDAQGGVSFFFHENKDRNGHPSARVLAVSNNHVLRANTTVDYQFMGAGAPRQYVRVCGMRRFERLVNETRALAAKTDFEAVRLTEEIVRLEAEPKSNNPEQADEDAEALRAIKDLLKKASDDNVKLQAFYKESIVQWDDIARRNIGFVDWAPKISANVDERRYTRDLATFELDPRKFKDTFQGNVVDLGTFCLIPHKHLSHNL